MKWLAIDSSTEKASVALLVDGVVHNEDLGAMRQHAELLLPAIDRLLSVQGVLCHQLDGIAFGCGPGSFTGLRIACSVAKGLAFAYDLPLFPVSTLASIAEEALAQDHANSKPVEVLAVIDARMQQMYWGRFNKDGILGAECVSAPESVVVPGKTPLYLAGVGYAAYATELPSSVARRIVKQDVIFPSAQAMLRLVAAGKVNPVTAAVAQPIYVRNQVTQGEPRG